MVCRSLGVLHPLFLDNCLNRNMCVVCFHSQWRAVVIGTSGFVFALLLLLLTVANREAIDADIQARLRQNCCSDGGGGEESTSGENRENGCVFVLLEKLFPWPLWAMLAAYSVVSGNLVVSALYRFESYSRKQP